MAIIESDVKRPKLDPPPPPVTDNMRTAPPAPPAVITDMSHYRITCLLGNSDDGRVVFTQGVIEGKEGVAVVLFEVNSIDLERVKLFLSSKSVVNLVMNNDIYNIFSLEPPPGTCPVKTTIIHPATEKIINKFTQKPAYFVEETPQMYETITRPYILSHLGDLSWVYNILEGNKEQDRVLCKVSDPVDGFVLTADLKWDMSSVENLYCLAIVERRDLYSVRDLTQDHLALLRSVRDKSLAAIRDKFNIPRSLIRVYVHYQPAYYHLHIHFAHMRYMMGAPIIGKSIALSDVIQNIEMRSDYYTRATLTYYMKDGHALSDELDKHGAIVRQ